MGAITSSNVANAIVKLVAADALPVLVGNLVMGNLTATVTALPLASFPTAANCSAELIAMVAGFGETEMLTRGPAVTMTVAVPESAPVVTLIAFANVPGVAPAMNSPA